MLEYVCTGCRVSVLLIYCSELFNLKVMDHSVKCILHILHTVPQGLKGWRSDPGSTLVTGSN